jgi:O-antigen ligase
VLLFQITRNISTTLYAGVLFLSYMWLYITYFYRHRAITRAIVPSPMASLFLLSLVWIPFVSLAHMEMGDYLIAFPRYFVTFPFILFCFLYREYRYEFIKQIFRIICVFIAVSALSVPYQIAFGRVSFFAESGYREGLERYASLAGSLSALGTLGALSLVLLLFAGDMLFTKTKRTLLIIITVLGMLMTLQKAAVANTAICFVAYVLIGGNGRLIKRSLAVIGLCLLAYGAYSVFRGSQFALYIDSIVRYSLLDSSVGMKQDLMQRTFKFPLATIRYFDMRFLDFISGIGFPSLAGTVGLSKFPSAHNNYFDLLLSGGVLHLVSYLVLMIRIPLKVIHKKLRGMKISSMDSGYSMVVILFLINMLIGAATFYQPITTVVIFVTICSYDVVTREVSLSMRRSLSRQQETPIGGCGVQPEATGQGMGGSEG